MMENIVLDTNCLIISLARESIYYPVWRDFFAGKYVLCYTNEIFAEYGEILARKMGEEIAANDFPKVDVIGIETVSYTHLTLPTT